MALIKSYMSRYGIEGNYWRIAWFELPQLGDGGFLHLELYKDKEARRSGNQPLEVKTIQLSLFTEKRVKMSQVRAFLRRLNNDDEVTVRDFELALRYIMLKEEAKEARELKAREDAARKELPPGDDFQREPSYPFNTFVIIFADAVDDI